MGIKSDSIDQQRAEAFTSPTVFATTLVAILLDEFGTEFFDFEPEVLREEVLMRYKVEIPTVNMDKLMGLIAALTTNMFYTSVPAFTHICNSLSGSGANFHTWDPVESHEVAWAITEIALNDPAQAGNDFKSRFSADVREYINMMLREEGLKNPPAILQMADDISQEIEEADTTFADDPVMFKAFYQSNANKGLEIKQYVQKNLQDLVHQLDYITLHNRDHKRWQSFLDKGRRGSQTKKPQAAR